MALFGKKKRTLDEILEDVKGLTPEEVKELHEKTSDLYKAEDEREIDKIEEEKADTGEVKDEKAEEVSEESEEIGKDVDEIKDEVKTDEETKPETVEDAPVDTPDPVEEDNTAEMVKALTDRVNALEATINELSELKKQMDEYVNKQKETFGYRSEGGGARKNYDDMTADELKHSILND